LLLKIRLEVLQNHTLVQRLSEAQTLSQSVLKPESQSYNLTEMCDDVFSHLE